MSRIVIVGAGISGLSLAYRLRQQIPNLDLTVLEAAARPGGTCWTARREGFQVEIGPNGFLDSKSSTQTLCRDLGLQERLVPASESAGMNRFLFLDGKLQALPGSPGAFLRSRLLTWRGKLSFLAERLRPGRRDSTDESIAAFARRRVGKEAASIFADALVTGIHAGDPELLSVGAAFPRIAALEREFGSVMKGLARTAKQGRADAAARGEPYRRGGKMWSFRDGLRVLTEALRDALGPAVHLGAAVRRITPTSRGDGRPGWVVQGEGRDEWHADAVVLACPSHQQTSIIDGVDAALAERIGGIAYNSVAVVALGFRQVDVPHSLDGFGYIAPQRTRRDLLGVQWCSSIFPERAPAGLVLLRAMAGGWNRSDIVGWDDQRLLAAIRAELKLALGIEKPPVFQHVVRWDKAIPQYQLGHLVRVAWIEERTRRHPGLYLGGNAYHGVALNDCTEQAEFLGRRIAADLSA